MTLRELRKQSKKTAAEVAAALGVTRNAVSNYEQGIRQPGLRQVLALAELYDVSEREIIEAQLESEGKKSKTCHNFSKTRLYGVYRNIIQRCYNPNNPDYKYYGALGVRLCDEWRNNFQSFYDWAYTNGYDENAKHMDCTLDRINCSGIYEPSNCRWITIEMQQWNKRNCSESEKQILEKLLTTYGNRFKLCKGENTL